VTGDVSVLGCVNFHREGSARLSVSADICLDEGLVFAEWPPVTISRPAGTHGRATLRKIVRRIDAFFMGNIHVFVEQLRR